MGTVPVEVLIQSVTDLLTEAYVGPPDPAATWFIDNTPDAGLLRVLARISAADASAPIRGLDGKESTIVANAEHLRWSLANANGAFRGQAYNPNWAESWAQSTVDDEKWDRLRQSLRAEFEAMLVILKEQRELPGEYLNGVLALIPHAAYHLGVIRQMQERVRQHGDK